MIQNIAGGFIFINAQKDSFPQAVTVVKHVTATKEAISRTTETFSRTSEGEYDSQGEENNTEGSVVSGLSFTAEYWSNIENYQSGRKPYYLDGPNGELEFNIEFDDEWVSKFDSIEGTSTQQYVKICEIWLAEKVFPALRDL